MEERVGSRGEHREGSAVERCEGQHHRHDRQDEAGSHANERVGGAHGASVYFAGLHDDGALELVERCIGCRAELLRSSSKLLASRRALLSALSRVRGLLTFRSISLGTARRTVLGLWIRLRAILRLVVSLLLALGGVLSVGGSLRGSVLLGDDLSHGALTRPLNDRSLEVLIRDQGKLFRRCFRQGHQLRLLNEGLDVVDNLREFVHDGRGFGDRLRLHQGSNGLVLLATPRLRLHRLALRSTPRVGLHGLVLRSTPRVGLHGLSLHDRLNHDSGLFNDRLHIPHHGSNRLVLRSTPRLRLHRLVLRATPRVRLHGLALRSTPGLRLHGLALRSTPGLRLHGLVLRATPRVRLHGLSLHDRLNHDSGLFNDRLHIPHHGRNRLALRSTPRFRLHRLALRSTPRIGVDGSSVNHRSGLRHGRLSRNDTPVCQPLSERRIQRRVRRHVGVQIRTCGRDIGKVLWRQRRIAHVGSGELRQIKSAHLYSSRTRRRSS